MSFPEVTTSMTLNDREQQYKCFSDRFAILNCKAHL